MEKKYKRVSAPWGGYFYIMVDENDD